jgi:hypothetical protein
MLAPMPASLMPSVRKLVPADLLAEPKFQLLIRELEEEINDSYTFSLKKGISKFYEIR